MCRTALNVTGDLALTTLVARGESDSELGRHHPQG